jgi:putative transposase
VFIPKYRKKAIFGQIRRELGEVLKKLAEQKESWIEEGHLMPGKSAIHIARRYAERKRNFVGQHFWARGFVVSTVGRDDEVIREYIRHQEHEDRRVDQLNLVWVALLRGQGIAKRSCHAALSGSHASEAPGFAGGAVTSDFDTASGGLTKICMLNSGRDASKRRDPAASQIAITDRSSILRRLQCAAGARTMKRITRPPHIICTLFSLLLCVACRTATAEPVGDIPTAPTLFYACMSTSKFVEYDSTAFAGKNPGPVYKDHYNLNLKMSAAFEAYLTQKYGFHGFVLCGRHNTLVEAQQWLQGRENQVQAAGKQYQYFATDWTYDAGPSASEPAAVAPANPSTASAGGPYTPASRVPTAFFVCISTMNDAEYDSAVFEAENTTFNDRMMQLTYQAYVGEKHKFHGSTSCMSRQTRAEVQNYLLEYAPAARGLATRRISTGWVYDPKATTAAPAPTPTTQVATATPAPKPASPLAAAPKPVAPRPTAPAAPTKPTAPAASSAPQSKFVVCKADRDPNTLYYNPPIDGGDGDYEVWQPSYKTFMQQNYGYERSAGCSKFPTLAEAQEYHQKMLEQARLRLSSNGTPLPIVITHWKYP